MSQEKWTYAPGYGTSYSVSDLGRVVSHVRTRGGKQIELFTWVTSRYRYVRLSWRGKKTNIRLHRLVAMAFIPNPDNKPCVNHKNGNRDDNRAENLEWVTCSENSRHAASTGLFNPARGDQHGMAKLTSDDVRMIRSLRSGGSRPGAIARQFGVHYNTVYDIVSRRNWCHVEAVA